MPGRDLAELLPPGEALSPRRAATIAAQILEALMATHAAGLVHGDLHPNNVRLRDGSDAVALTDFGTASVFPLSDDDDHGPFRAPELSSAILTPLTDIYAVGALLRAMLPPVDRAGGSSSARALADGLRAVAARAVAQSPAERYPTAATMRDALLAVTGPLALPAVPLAAGSAAAIAPPAIESAAGQGCRAATPLRAASPRRGAGPRRDRRWRAARARARGDADRHADRARRGGVSHPAERDRSRRQRGGCGPERGPTTDHCGVQRADLERGPDERRPGR